MHRRFYNVDHHLGVFIGIALPTKTCRKTEQVAYSDKKDILCNPLHYVVVADLWNADRVGTIVLADGVPFIFDWSSCILWAVIAFPYSIHSVNQ